MSTRAIAPKKSVVALHTFRMRWLAMTLRPAALQQSSVNMKMKLGNKTKYET